MHVRYRVAAVSAVLLLAAACGSSGGHAGHGGEEKIAQPVEGAKESTVTAVDIDFKPDKLELAAGQPLNVTVTNEGEAEHDFTLEEADVHVNVQPGESKTTALTIDEPGQYKAVCTVDGHAEAGMTVAVTVK